ncbi:hypothetical protein NQZ79_g5647 [Umbelopsis isabellina]|nr:hypothetical protein NQZ79_g5647 [Umbelopsis isabellina]
MDSSDTRHCTSNQDSFPSAKTNGTKPNNDLNEDHTVPIECNCVRSFLYHNAHNLQPSLSKLLKDSELCHSVTQHFAQWGTVLNVKVFRDWMQRPYGFVQFEDIADAQKALAEASGTILNGRCIRCEPARVNRTIYLGGMPNDTSKKDIQSFAENFGGVENISLIKRSLKQQPAVDAFIRFHYRDDAVNAYLAIAADPPFQAVAVEWAANVNYANEDPNDVPEQYFSSILYVRNLPFHAKQEALYNSLLLQEKKLGNSTQCCAYVHYKTQEEAVRAQESENGSSMQGRTLQVTLAHDSNLSSGMVDDKMQNQPRTNGKETPSNNDRKQHSKILHATARYSKPQADCKVDGVSAPSLNKSHIEKRYHDKIMEMVTTTIPDMAITGHIILLSCHIVQPQWHPDTAISNHKITLYGVGGFAQESPHMKIDSHMGGDMKL